MKRSGGFHITHMVVGEGVCRVRLVWLLLKGFQVEPHHESATRVAAVRFHFVDILLVPFEFGRLAVYLSASPHDPHYKAAFCYDTGLLMFAAAVVHVYVCMCVCMWGGGGRGPCASDSCGTGAGPLPQAWAPHSCRQ